MISTPSDLCPVLDRKCKHGPLSEALIRAYSPGGGGESRAAVQNSALCT
jgi:hypothetical protein